MIATGMGAHTSRGSRGGSACGCAIFGMVGRDCGGSNYLKVGSWCGGTGSMPCRRRSKVEDDDAVTRECSEKGEGWWMRFLSNVTTKDLNYSRHGVNWRWFMKGIGESRHEATKTMAIQRTRMMEEYKNGVA
ncbi:Mannuronan C-5-epimerase [Sesbania bispinosa]|nr:Mannuronan C-5-epimerase [Sesbania bispinosa]